MKINFKAKGKFKDNRKTHRLKIPLKIEYKLLPRKKILEQSFSEDISGGGFRLSLNRRFNKGDKLKTLIYFPKESCPVTAFSEVVWCKRRLAKNKKIFDAGIKYIKIAPGDRERFVFLFCEMMINYFVLSRSNKPKI